MGNKQVKQHFENAQKTGVLKISQLRLNEFPSALRQFPNVLKTLDISENKFVTLPDELGQFTLLKHLNINSNKLQELPECIGLLIKLETLYAMNNLLVSIPPSLGECKHLKQVHFSNNQIEQFPIQVR
jgi:Leucine-rich repeat (LRR) protein